jgi:uncharacterized protein HemX
MNDADSQPASPESESRQSPLEDNPSAGPNLALIYSLIALALAAAIGFALMIVLPFHHRH